MPKMRRPVVCCLAPTFETVPRRNSTQNDVRILCFLLAHAIRTADRMNKSVDIYTADCAAITRWHLFSRFVTPILTCATTE